MTSPGRVFAILDLFTNEHPVWQTEEINGALGYTRATGYRYVKDLVDAGFLQKLTAGSYALGGRIIALDYQLRQTDPVLLAAIPSMETLAVTTGLDAVLSVLFAGPQIIDVYRVNGERTLELTFGRGRPRPLFRSGAPKILWSGQPRTHLLKVYETHSKEIAEGGMGNTWTEFRAYLTAVRKEGMYFSIGELQKEVGAAVVPIHNPDRDVVASLALVGSDKKLKKASAAQLRTWLTVAQTHIEKALQAQMKGR